MLVFNLFNSLGVQFCDGKSTVFPALHSFRHNCSLDIAFCVNIIAGYVFVDSKIENVFEQQFLTE